MGEPLPTEANLVTCPVCGAWPMAVATRRSWFPRPTATFICPKCHFKADEADLKKARLVKPEHFA